MIVLVRAGQSVRDKWAFASTACSPLGIPVGAQSDARYFGQNPAFGREKASNESRSLS
jgi:hypothetical protein